MRRHAWRVAEGASTRGGQISLGGGAWVNRQEGLQVDGARIAGVHRQRQAGYEPQPQLVRLCLRGGLEGLRGAVVEHPGLYAPAASQLLLHRSGHAQVACAPPTPEALQALCNPHLHACAASTRHWKGIFTGRLLLKWMLTELDGQG